MATIDQWVPPGPPYAFYNESAVRWEPPPGGVELAHRNFQHEYLLDCSAIKPSRFDKIRSMETMAQTCANPQKQPTAAEIMWALWQKREPMKFNVAPQFPPMKSSAAAMQLMRDAQAQMMAVCGLPAAMEKADEDIKITVSVTHDPGFNAFNVRATPVMGIDWGAGEEPTKEPKDTPERARERSEGLCGWNKGVRDTDKPGIAAAAAAEDDYWDSAGFVRTSRLQLQDGRHVTMYRFADEAKPSAGLLTIAEPTHRFGGWGA